MDHKSGFSSAALAEASPSSSKTPQFTPHPLAFDQVRIENTNHCGYKCIMCPREQQTRDLGFMPMDDLDLILDRLGDFRGQFHLHGFGEPLLDKSLVEKIRRVKERQPSCYVLFFTTLGVRKDEAFFRDLAESGIDHIHVSYYGFNSETYRKVAQVDTFDLAKHNLELLAAARTAAGVNFTIMLQTWSDKVWRKWSDEIRKQRAEFLAWVDGLGVERHEKGNVHNYGGGRSFNKPPMEGLCSVAWGLRQRILQVAWNLDVIPCCFDFNASVVYGNLRDQTLEEIFSSGAYRTFIEAHLRNDLSAYPVCAGCERCFRP